MPKTSPKHLERRTLSGAARLRLIGAAALSAVALVAAVVGFGPEGSGTPRTAGTLPPTTLIASVPTTTTTPPTTTTRPGGGGARPSPPAGGLLADPGFEAGLGPWRPLGGARLVRTGPSRSGRWAALLTPGGAGAGDPGLAVADVTGCLAGVAYAGELWVKASRPGLTVEVRLVEVVNGVRSAGDTVGVVLEDGRWRRVGVTHVAHQAGARLRMEVMAPRLRGPDRLLFDDVSITRGGTDEDHTTAARAPGSAGGDRDRLAAHGGTRPAVQLRRPVQAA